MTSRLRQIAAIHFGFRVKYTLEQVAHYRALAERRPDLIARLAPHLRSGRLEFAGGFASTLELNLPHGESLVRNQSLGLRWLRAQWDIAPATAYTVDTFGHPAQFPQVFRQFGFRHLLTSRAGGDRTEDLFLARGLDGSTLVTACWHTYAAYVRPENIAEIFYSDWTTLEPLFDKAAALRGPGPYLVIPYTENEAPVSLRAFAVAAARAKTHPDETWHVSTPADFFAALDATPRALPQVCADLNPEFTGCFSNRTALRLRNRAIEALLLDAEVATALARQADAGRAAGVKTLESAWWDLALVQFHDVLTGSHPTPVYHEAMALLERAEHSARAALRRALAPSNQSTAASTASTSSIATASAAAPEAPAALLVGNGLPWARREWVSLPGGYTVAVDLPPSGSVLLDPPSGAPSAPALIAVGSAVLENAFIRLEADDALGLRRLVWKPTGATVLADAGALLVAQHDSGNFQIEQPESAEIAAASGPLRLARRDLGEDGHQLVLAGEFPPLAWAGAGAHLSWELTFTLRPDRPALDLAVRLDWRGEATRVRLRLPTGLDTGSAIHEVPFGTVRRQAYTPRANARGEWPVQRWAALEDGVHGLALANTGVAGVETLGGTLFTTLLRAPVAEYVGMVPDRTSSQHGEHAFEFALLPYAGSWREAGLIRLAQALNHPPRVWPLAVRPVAAQVASFAPAGLTLEGDPSVVFSCAKPADDGGAAIIVRVYEGAGVPARARLRLNGLCEVFPEDLREGRLPSSPLLVQDEAVDFSLRPFEILTLRLVRPL